MELSVIDRLYEDHIRLRDHLETAGELSQMANVDAQFRKVLLLSAASLFEVQIRQMLIDYVSERAQGDARTIAFVKAKAIERQYHTYFKWDAKNANQFFGLFGPDLKDYMTLRLAADPSLETGVRSFLELGETRNQLVHRDFASFPLEKTVGEIYELYRAATVFVNTMPGCLRALAA